MSRRLRRSSRWWWERPRSSSPSRSRSSGSRAAWSSLALRRGRRRGAPGTARCGGRGARARRRPSPGWSLAGRVALLSSRGGRSRPRSSSGSCCSLAPARGAIAVHVRPPGAAPPSHAVLFFNPKSGGGKAERFKLADEARARGIEPIELTPGDDLETLVARPSTAAPTRWRWPAATARRRSSRRSPPSTTCPTRASRPARATTSRSTSASTATTSSAPSTRSSTAASGASTSPRSTAACSSTTSRSVVYAEAVQREDYRDAKLRTLLDTVPDALGPDGDGSTCAGPGRAARAPAGAVVLVSNNRYRLGRGSSARARARGSTRACSASTVVGGALRAAARTSARRLQRAAARVVGADVRGRRATGPVPAGIDGEALRARPAAELSASGPACCACASRAQHPGASPSARGPRGPVGGCARAGAHRVRPDHPSVTSRRGAARVSMQGET